MITIALAASTLLIGILAGAYFLLDWYYDHPNLEDLKVLVSDLESLDVPRRIVSATTRLYERIDFSFATVAVTEDGPVSFPNPGRLYMSLVLPCLAAQPLAFIAAIELPGMIGSGRGYYKFGTATGLIVRNLDSAQVALFVLSILVLSGALALGAASTGWKLLSLFVRGGCRRPWVFVGTLVVAIAILAVLTALSIATSAFLATAQEPWAFKDEFSFQALDLDTVLVVAGLTIAPSAPLVLALMACLSSAIIWPQHMLLSNIFVMRLSKHAQGDPAVLRRAASWLRRLYLCALFATAFWILIR